MSDPEIPNRAPTPSSSDEIVGPSVDTWWTRPRLWLAVMVASFFAISLYSGIVAYVDFQLQNPTDAGIITQAVASTAHGHVTPFFEYWDCLHKSRCSLLLVHPGLILYAAAPFYVLVPSTLTLFALRSAVVAAAAVPLYWLTRQVTRSAGKGLLASGMYLLWAPTLAGDAFSLHLESLFPIELITLAALWQAGRYRLGLLAATTAFVTYEVSPLFTFLVGAFFLAPYIERAFRERWRRWRSERARRRSARWSLSLWLGAFREGWRTREVRYLFVLMGASVVAFVALSLFINVWGCRILDVACPSLSPGVVGVFSNPSSAGFHSPGTILSSPLTIRAAEYWLILYALVGFIPLLSPRALILTVPWIGWTFLVVNSNFTALGREYSLIAAGPIFIGFAYGLNRVPLNWFRAKPAGTSSVSTTYSNGVRRRGPRARRQRVRWGRVGWIGVVTAVVVANALVMPIDPALTDLGLTPGSPFVSNYYHHSLEISPGFGWIEQLVATIPYSATIVSPAALFPLIANFPHAFVPVPGPESNLPFNVSAGPQYVFTTSSVGQVGVELARNISNPLRYGLVAYEGQSALGPLLLYEQFYSGPAKRFGPPLSQAAATFLPDDGFTAGPKGIEAASNLSPSGRVIESVGGPKPTGTVWTGPDAFLPAGNYSLNVTLMVSGTNLTRHSNATAVRVVVQGVGGVIVNETFSMSRFISGEWTNLSFAFSLINPLPEMEVDGFLESDQVSLAVASGSLEPVGT